MSLRQKQKRNGTDQHSLFGVKDSHTVQKHPQLFSIPAATHFLPVSGIGCWEVSVPCHMFHFRGCLSVFMTWQLVFPRISDLKESGGSQKCLLWPSLEVTHCHFHSIPLITLMSPIHCGRKLHKSENTRK